MADNPSIQSLPGKTRPLRTITPTAEGVGISAEYMNSIIDRIEDLFLVAQSQKPVSGNYINISYLSNGAVINVVTM